MLHVNNSFAGQLVDAVLFKPLKKNQESADMLHHELWCAATIISAVATPILLPVVGVAGCLAKLYQKEYMGALNEIVWAVLGTAVLSPAIFSVALANMILPREFNIGIGQDTAGAQTQLSVTNGTELSVTNDPNWGKVNPEGYVDL